MLYVLHIHFKNVLFLVQDIYIFIYKTPNIIVFVLYSSIYILSKYLFFFGKYATN